MEPWSWAWTEPPAVWGRRPGKPSEGWKGRRAETGAKPKQTVQDKWGGGGQDAFCKHCLRSWSQALPGGRGTPLSWSLGTSPWALRPGAGSPRRPRVCPASPLPSRAWLWGAGSRPEDLLGHQWWPGRPGPCPPCTPGSWRDQTQGGSVEPGCEGDQGGSNKLRPGRWEAGVTPGGEKYQNAPPCGSLGDAEGRSRGRTSYFSKGV